MVEADIGYPLLVRDGRNGVHPTPAGEFVLAWARVVLPQKKETFRMAKAIHDGTVPPLRMGFSSFVNSFLLDNFRLVYQGMFPDCEIHLSGADTQHNLERLEAGTLDCALLPMPIDRDRWDVREVAHSPLVICMRSDDPLSTQAQVDIHEVAPRLKVFRDPELHPAAHARLSEMFSELGRCAIPRGNSALFASERRTAAYWLRVTSELEQKLTGGFCLLGIRDYPSKKCAAKFVHQARTLVSPED
jgi:DNA-binding transcriptional LysR family regulator